MTCLPPHALATAAAGHDHVGCDHCRAIVDELRATGAALATLPAPALSSERRAALADAVTIAAQRIGPSTRPRRLGVVVGVGVVVAAAACLAIVLARSTPATDDSAPIAVTPAKRSQISIVPIAPKTSVQPLDGATYVIERVGDRETIRVHGGGGVAIESASAIDVEVGSSTIALAPGRFEIRARRDVIASVHVFAGSAQIQGDPRTTPILAGETWELSPTPRPTATPTPTPDRAVSDHEPAPAGNPPLAVTGKEWFRIGWLAFRDHRDADAIAAFDRATDPSIAEDAAFWAAFAAERSGQAAAALARFEHFTTTYPHSDRARVAAEHAARLK